MENSKMEEMKSVLEGSGGELIAAGKINAG
jgi:hypothetical protein